MSSPAPTFIENAAHLVAQAFVNLDQSGRSTSKTFTCGAESDDKSAWTNFLSEMKSVVGSSQYVMMEDKLLMTYPLEMEVMAKNASFTMDMGTWGTQTGFVKAAGYSHKTIPRWLDKLFMYYIIFDELMF